jgi:wobble nucleotide-excising tRNase
MITKINKLKRFGIYQDFSWGPIDHFKKKNLIYGWNYSGKTTLSKLFQVLEAKDKNKCFSGSEFEITVNDTDTIKTFNQDNLQSFPFGVKVFNSEFIKDVFTWDEPKSGFHPISFYLGDKAGDLKGKIDKLEIINERFLKLKEEKYKPIIASFNAYDSQSGHFSLKAKDVRDNYLPGIYDPTTFNKGDFKRIVEQVKTNIEGFILEEIERDLIKKEAESDNRYERQNENLMFSENLESLFNQVSLILEDSAPKSISFSELESDEELFIWVQKGISHHHEADNCKFCDQPLPKGRIDDLNAFYSDKLKEIQNAIEKIQKAINDEREKINIQFPNSKFIAELFKEDYKKAVESYQSKKLLYSAQLATLELDLKAKGASIFTPIKSTEIDHINLTESIREVEELIEKHNEWISQFSDRKRDAISKILKHYVAEYLKTESYLEKEKEKVCAERIIQTIEIKISANKQLIRDLNQKLSSTAKGQGELNDILEILLHRDDIKIEIRNDKFRLERSGHPAKHLSEGEKSAIAFAYFLTELKSFRIDNPPKLPKTIIFIDDPISSLDSNHIFQVRSLLKDFFTEEDFAQLFISTHNFEFFSMLYDSGIFSRQTKREDLRPLFFIKRFKEGYSDIIKMPRTFSDYKSEYVGLFNILKDFHEREDQESFEYLLLLPNALRRFVELYTLSKYPADNDSSVDKRVEIVFNPKDKPRHNTKLLNWFSHQNQFEKLNGHDEKIIQISDAISDLLTYIEKEDELHWKGLNGLAD